MARIEIEKAGRMVERSKVLVAKRLVCHGGRWTYKVCGALLVVCYVPPPGPFRVYQQVDGLVQCNKLWRDLVYVVKKKTNPTKYMPIKTLENTRNDRSCSM